ncbi:MAG TPA: ABC transporter ATP-binding protein [Aggregatilineales bacterium]|nr:ABC transporter ATP-binding protein [Anaerolineales bacterium]HRE48641.1 ABC transporter ATP-binding protein [Aggregatilineales bacterium]
MTKTFGWQRALREVTFTVGRGACLALLGANGSGKTTLMRILAGLSRPTSGKATVGGWAIPQEAAHVRPNIGFIGHQTLLYDDLTALENLLFYATLYGVPRSDAERRAADLLGRVGLGRRATDRAGTFSRGMGQRLALARALMHDPAVLLFDEPYTGLDPSGAAFLDTLIAEWRGAGKTILLTLHDLTRAAALCEGALILKSGRLVAEVAAGGMMTLPARFAEVTG